MVEALHYFDTNCGVKRYTICILAGVYRHSELPAISNPDIVAVASSFPRAVICLISALAFHDLTTQVPHEVSLALEKGAETPVESDG